MNSNRCSKEELALLLVALGRAGIEIAPHPSHPNRLRHRPAVLPPDLSALLSTHRAVVIRLLVNGYTPVSDSNDGYIMTERIGIADELGMPTHAGSTAWLIAVGESINCRCDTESFGIH